MSGGADDRAAAAGMPGQGSEEADALRAEVLLQANEQLVLAVLHAEELVQTLEGKVDALARSSQHDPLTDTPNRLLMRDRLESAISLGRRYGTRSAVLSIDLDNFKQINDTLGHAVGDEVLRLVARRLESVVRDSDAVSRHGGDEFLVLLAEVTQASDAALIATKIQSALAGPMRVGTHELRVGASIGMAIYPEDGEDAATLIRRADAAMYHRKRRGGHGFGFYREGLESDPIPEASALGIPQAPTARSKLALAEHEMRLRDLREANERLVIAALKGQKRAQHAAAAQRRQSMFLTMAAHELRKPLSAIRTAAEVLDSAGADEQQRARLRLIITGQVAHLSRLVDDLLNEAPVSADKDLGGEFVVTLPMIDAPTADFTA